MHKFILLLSLVISQVSLGAAAEEETKPQPSEKAEVSTCAEASEGPSASDGVDYAVGADSTAGDLLKDQEKDKK